VVVVAAVNMILNARVTVSARPPMRLKASIFKIGVGELESPHPSYRWQYFGREAARCPTQITATDIEHSK